MKNGTILLFSGSLSKICCTKLDLLQDIRKFYGALFDVHGFLKYERRHQSVAFNSLAQNDNNNVFITAPNIAIPSGCFTNNIKN